MTLEKPILDPKRLADESRFYARLLAGIPSPMPPIIEWAEANVRLNGAKGEMFRIDNTPWTRLPIELCFNPEIREVTLVKPTRTGGSAAGHAVICGWSKTAMGQIQYNWPTDKKAADMWEKELENIFKRSLKISPEQKGLIKLPNCIISVQGVFAECNLDSDTIPNQVNEEVHAWERGMLAKAYGRGDACDFPIRFNISNAGMEGDQLHQAFKDGTMRQWEVACPGCKKFHVMRMRWDERHPELGGLWYDYEKAKRTDGNGPSAYDYNVIEKTILYRMPCGHIVRNDITERRALSASGRYSEPFNTGARPGVESMTYQAVTCHTMDWVGIVKRRNNALAARRVGDEDSYRKYIQEVECEFYSADKIPFDGQIVLNTGVIKNREGLADRAVRVAFFDWQLGYKHKGQLIHYWAVIEDIKADLNSQIVFEGKINSESELLELLREFEVQPEHVLIDASKNTKPILQFCYQNGFKAVMGNASHVGLFRDHDDKVPRYYSAGKPIYRELNVPPVYELVFGQRQSNGDVAMVPNPSEPLVIMYNLGGLLANHFFIRELKMRVTASCAEEKPPRGPRADEYFERVIPGDVSEEFLKQYGSWERVGKDAKGKTGDVKSPGAEAFRQVNADDHMLQCLAGIDLFKDWSFMLGDALANLGLQPEKSEK
jgi:hypothetical protein